MLRLHAIAIVAFLGLTACQDSTAALDADTLPRVSVAYAEAPPQTWSRTLLGVLEGQRDAVLGAQTGGVVRRRVAEPGTQVATGDAILELDRRETGANLRVASAAVDDAEAVRDDAERTLKRLETLGDAGAQSNLDAARTGLKRARANLDAARARRDLAAVQHSYKTLKAPFAGEVTSLDPEVGELVQPGVPIARVVDSSALSLVVSLTEDEVGAARDPRSRFFLPGDVEAKLVSLGSAADPRTRAWKAELLVPTGAFQPGQSVQVRADLAVPPASASVPRRALIDGHVQVVVDGAVQKIPVTLVGERGDDALIDGVDPGAAVVTWGPRLQPGARVVVLEQAP